MENGVMIIDKIEAFPAIVIVLFFVASLMLFIGSGIAMYKDVFGIDIALLLAALMMLFFSIVMACNSYDGYKVVTSEETKLEKFYADWDVKQTMGSVYYVIPQSKDSIKMGEEYDRSRY